MLEIRWAQVGPTTSQIATCRIERLQTVLRTEPILFTLAATIVFVTSHLNIFIFYLSPNKLFIHPAK